MNYYPVKCLLPNDRFVVLDHSGIKAVDIKKTDDSILIKLYNKENKYEFITYEALGELFSFSYTSHLIFFHEKDLRNSIYNIIGNYNNDEEEDIIENNMEYHSNTIDGKIHSFLSIRYIGIVDPSGNNIGYGVYTEDFISSKSYLGEYVGLVSDFKETFIEKNNYNAQYPSCDGSLSINAREYGNVIRFINHSMKPNAEFKAIRIHDLMHIVCIAISDVDINTQITVNYGIAFWVDKPFKPSII